jgi:NAD(P)-dependent dehydrogenase (short-subunit alcohol dehydrogenase family)
MDPSLTVIIGYGPGLGAAIARRFLAGGHEVLALARDPARHPATPGLTLARADAADPEALPRALAGRPVRALVYNAYRATMAEAGPSSLDPAALVADFQVNVAGALAAVRAVLPGMRAAGQGSLIFTGGGLALDPTGWPAAASLAIGKAGLRSLGQSLHAELAPEGLHAGSVTVAGQVAPGTPFDPDRIAQAFWDFHQDPPGAFRAEILFRG